VLPPHFPKLEISLIEILPGVIHAAELGKITPHTDVIITGQGVSGLVITQVIKQFSPRSLVVTDLKDANLALARKYGATHTYKIPSEHAATMDTVGRDFPNGFEVVVPCLLDGDMMSDALDLLALGGRIVAYGAAEPPLRMGEGEGAHARRGLTRRPPAPPLPKHHRLHRAMQEF
jgi:threonine dehydrogenase-like Zn-dependent dehydrogenase